MSADEIAMDGRLVTRLHQAMNDHDLEAFLACFADDYDARSRRIQTEPFEAASRFARIGRRCSAVWSEWRWRGTQADGGRLDMADVILLGVRDDRIVWARLYIEPIDQAGAGIDVAVGGMTAGH